MSVKLCAYCMRPTNSEVCPHCGRETEVRNYSHQLPAGTVLNQRYLIGRVLGQGGFGITYIGRDLLMESTVAIKEFYPHTLVTRNVRQSLGVSCADESTTEQFRRSRDRFLKEARTLVKLNSVAGIVHVQNVCLENNTAYIIMEYLEGQDLKQHLQGLGHPLSAEQTLSVFQPVLFALRKVHEQGLIHRDISPDNIMMLKDGNVKLLDFGAARELNREESGHTFASELVVKQGFAPIEQYREHADLGPAADIYALCASMYYCMTGQVPNNAPDRFMGNDNVNWKQIPGLTKAQTAILEKGLAIRADSRLTGVEQLWEGLYNSQENPEPEPEKTEKKTAGKNRKKGKKSWIPILAGILSVLLILCTAVLMKGNPEILPAVNRLGNRPGSAWKKNMLSNQYILAESRDRYKIKTVCFLDTLKDAPDYAWDASVAQDGSVLAWTKSETNKNEQDLYVAGEGGVNGAQACRGLFKNYRNLREISFNDCFFTEDATDMGEMFADCRNLQTLDLSSLDTSNVADMSSIFYNCDSLQTLDLSSIDTSKVADMSWMFYNCIGLRTLDLSSLDTSNVVDMSYMFRGCSSLQTLNLDSLDTSSVADISSMFYNCDSLQTLNLDSFDTSNVTNMSRMFSSCSNLQTLNLNSFATSNVADMSSMFYNCSSLQALNLDSFDTSKVADMSSMFYNCNSLQTLDLSSFDTSNVTDMSFMFVRCSKLAELDVSGFYVSNETKTTDMFKECNKLKKEYKNLGE